MPVACNARQCESVRFVSASYEPHAIAVRGQVSAGPPSHYGRAGSANNQSIGEDPSSR
jgi:hypothetical protein